MAGMGIPEMVQIVLGVGQTLVGALMGARGQWRQERQERRDEVADHFQDLGICIAEMAVVLRNREISFNIYTGKLPQYASRLEQDLRDLPEDVLSREEIKKLAEDLIRAAGVSPGEFTEDDLVRIYQTSGMLTALAENIRLAP